MLTWSFGCTGLFRPSGEPSSSFALLWVAQRALVGFTHTHNTTQHTQGRGAL
jgi:hypothetical protein